MNDPDRPVLVVCEACQGEGRFFTCDGGPDEDDNGECPYCDGTGMELVPSEPMTLDDALELDGEKFRQLTGQDHGPWRKP